VIARALISGLILVILAGGSATAADPAGVMGRWVERFPNGNAMVVDIAPAALAYHPEDATGKVLAAENRAAVTYKDLGGDDIVVQFPGGDGGLMIHQKGPDAIILDFPGAGAHLLTRDPAGQATNRVQSR
jgi:hypothetical protein